MTPCKVAIYAIAKDEAHHVERWAASCADADYRIVLDTGSSDGTIEALTAAGVDVHRGGLLDRSFRFDYARNEALAHVPDDADVCVSLDLDEILEPGFIDAVRAKWEEGRFDKAHPWFNTGGWWRCDRVHSRHGWTWQSPCHEVTVWTGQGTPVDVDIEASMRHLPDEHDRSPLYLDLLELAVAEEPLNGRMWWYLCRQNYYAANWQACLDAADKAVALSVWPPEAAATCRLAAEAADKLGRFDSLEWLTRGTHAAPNEAEAWAALSRWHSERGQWNAALVAAERGLNCPVATHYMADQALRSWGMLDLAALAAHETGNSRTALTHGYAALLANPADPRLMENLRWYVKSLGMRTDAVIATAPGGERAGELSRLTEQLNRQGVTVFVSESGAPIHDKWNVLLDEAETSHSDTEWNVLVINDDVTVDADFITVMVAALRADPDVQLSHPAQPDGSFTGWAHMMRGEDGWRYDNTFAWWYGDTDLLERIKRTGGKVAACAAGATHLHPNESTFSDLARLELARADEARYAEKWQVDPSTLFFGRQAQDEPTVERNELVEGMVRAAVDALRPDTPAGALGIRVRPSFLDLLKPTAEPASDFLLDADIDLINDGVLWLINRVIFHPRGFALAIEDDGSFSLIGDGAEVWSFTGDEEDAKFAAVEATLDRARKRQADLRATMNQPGT